jgi:hypothetical protein
MMLIIGVAAGIALFYALKYLLIGTEADRVFAEKVRMDFERMKRNSELMERRRARQPVPHHPRRDIISVIAQSVIGSGRRRYG